MILPRAQGDISMVEFRTIAAATSCPWTPPPLAPLLLPPSAALRTFHSHFPFHFLRHTLAMAHAAGNSVEAVIDLGAEPSFEVGAWPVASDDDDGRW